MTENRSLNLPNRHGLFLETIALPAIRPREILQPDGKTVFVP